MTAAGSTLDDVRRTLYAGPRETFVERRKELAGEARRGGDRDQAKLIGEMRKPTAAAHLLNMLARTADSSLQELIERGASIRRAMAEGDDRETRSLLQGRSATLATAAAQVRAIARANGDAVSGAVGDQIMQTLRAAMASDEAAAAVRGGTLTDALDEPGFEGVSIESTARAPSPAKSGRAKAPPPPEVAVDREADHAAERAAATARINAATADVKRVEKALAVATKRRDTLGRERDRLASELAEIDDELTAAQTAVADVETQLSEATAALQAASESAPE
jgi:hypothetical protein